MKGNLTKYRQGCVAKWTAWKEAGHAPKTREAAIVVMSKELGRRKALKYVAQMLKAGLVKRGGADIHDAAGNVVNVSDVLSFAVWDLTSNGGHAVDYSDVAQNWFTGVMTQIANILYTASRVVVSMPAVNGGKPIPLSLPTMLYKSGGSGLVAVRTMKRDEFEEIAEQLMQSAKYAVHRFKAMGADLNKVKALLRKLEDEAIAVYKAETKAMSAKA